MALTITHAKVSTAGPAADPAIAAETRVREAVAVLTR